MVTRTHELKCSVSSGTENIRSATSVGRSNLSGLRRSNTLIASEKPVREMTLRKRARIAIVFWKLLVLGFCDNK